MLIAAVVLFFSGLTSYLTQVNALQTKFATEYAKQQFANYTVAGQVTGIYKNAGTFSYVRLYGA